MRGFLNSKSVSFITVIITLLLTACAEEPPKPTTMRVCDDRGCADRPLGYTTYDPMSQAPKDDGRMAALEQMAENDPKAAYDLALRLFRGDGVRQDSYKAIKWMRVAGEAGDFQAQKALGKLYLTGLGEMGSDPGEAEKWLNITASKGDRESETLLKEAQFARQNEQARYQVYDRWRRSIYDSWAIGYRYYWNWGNNGWYLY
jgi:TPR repeat protein